MHIADAIDDVFALLRRANKYIDETEPWVLGKEGGDKGGTIVAEGTPDEIMEHTNSYTGKALKDLKESFLFNN